VHARDSGTPDASARRHRLVMLLYAVTLFSNASLLFSVQPLVAKTLLPLLGGSASVWTTCMLFFQFMLLAGYLYADRSFRWLSAGRRILAHGVLLGLATVVLPLQIHGVPVEGTSPVTRLLGTLTSSVGLPFFLLASTAPMLQRWFSRTAHPAATDPYFLYAVSNVGSLAALLSYPAVVEPLVTLSTQVRWWNAGFAGAALLTIACAAVANAGSTRVRGEQPQMATAGRTRVSSARRAQWVLLSFVPSSLMLAVTRYLSTDVAPVPLLWVVPLAIYLLTYVLAFGARTRRVTALADAATPFAAIALALLIVARLGSPLWLVLLLHLLAFAVIALACHGRLAAARPGVDHLTEFYFWLAVGGVFGGLFNSIVAPAVFVTTAEYPITLALACVTRVRHVDLRAVRGEWSSWTVPVAAGLLVLLAGPALRWAGLPPGFLLIFLAAPALLCYSVSRRPALFALGVALMLGAGAVRTGPGRSLLENRTFYGSYRVAVDPSGRYHELFSGSTLHGRQLVDAGGPLEPLAYYHREGPVGDVFRARRRAGPLRVAVVGLGVGALSAYAAPDDSWTFFEIDPEVERIARDRRWFTYLARAAVPCTVVLGDGRVSMTLHARDQYDLIVIDAFTSDAIPVHLLTREALALYLSRLRPGGLVAFHISNRHLGLAPVLTTLARDAGGAAMMRQDESTAAKRQARFPSQWFVIARHAGDLSAIGQHAGWSVPQVAPSRSVWTDDFSNLLATLTWR
jgi:hypothetical protein